MSVQQWLSHSVSRSQAIKYIVTYVISPIIFISAGIYIGQTHAEETHQKEIQTLQIQANRAKLAADVFERARAGGRILCHRAQGDTETYTSPLGVPFPPHERENFFGRALLSGECYAPPQDMSPRRYEP